MWAQITGHYLDTIDTILLSQCCSSLTHCALSYCLQTKPLICATLRKYSTAMTVKVTINIY